MGHIHCNIIYVSGIAVPNDLRIEDQGTRCRQRNYTFLTPYFQVMIANPDSLELDMSPSGHSPTEKRGYQ